ncbi:MAG: DJ-1/PfpI family protein [Saprospiraceae bacterium]|nr:DJ-1/PfpI family protein [Saprospiraceae bacterium]
MKIFLSLMLFLVAFPLTAQDTQSKHYQVAFLLVDGVYNTEVMAPFDIFHHTVFHTQPGMRVFTVAPTLDPITTFEGLRVLPDYAFDDSELPFIDILVVASAKNSMDADLENTEMINFVRLHGAKADFVLSLCDGAFVLAKAGLVDGKESTTFPSDIPRYRKMFPELKVHEDVSFVHDGTLITSAGGAKSYEAALYLCEILYGKKIAQGIARGMVIDWQLEDLPYMKSQP